MTVISEGSGEMILPGSTLTRDRSITEITKSLMYLNTCCQEFLSILLSLQNQIIIKYVSVTYTLCRRRYGPNYLQGSVAIKQLTNYITIRQLLPRVVGI